MNLAAGEARHWLIPLKKRTQFETVLKFSARDPKIRLKITPQARNKWDNLPTTLEARLVTRIIKGKAYSILTSMKDPLQYPVANIADLYAHR